MALNIRTKHTPKQSYGLWHGAQCHTVPIYISWCRQSWTIQLKYTFETRQKRITVSYKGIGAYSSTCFEWDGGCASAMGVNFTLPSSSASPKPLHNQLICCYICSRGVFGYQSFQTPHCYCRCNRMYFLAVDRGSITTRIHRWSIMIYGSLQTEFVGTNYNGHIHR